MSWGWFWKEPLVSTCTTFQNQHQLIRDSQTIPQTFLLTPCTRITRGDQCHAHHVGGQLGWRVLTPRRLKCSLYCITRSIELYIKTHSQIAHQYGAFKIFCWWRQVKWVNTIKLTCKNFISQCGSLFWDIAENPEGICSCRKNNS